MSIGAGSSLARKSRAVLPELAALVVVAAFVLHARALLAQFSGGGYLLDAGWFAYLFQSGDPWLHGPKVLGADSFYQHHLSPYFFLLGAPLHRFAGLTGQEIFALHQGFFSALFAASLAMLALDARRAEGQAVALAGAVSIGALATLLFRAADYPHFEIALLALESFGFAAFLRGWRVAFAAALLALPLVREDGGLYAALACLMIAAITYKTARRRDLTLLVGAAALGIGVSLAEQWLQRRLFPATNTFLGNLSGDGWRHVDATTLIGQIRTDAGDPCLLFILLGTALLARFDRRYAAALALVAPLLLLYFLSPREMLWTFSFYYGLPWLIACVGWVAVFAERARGGLALRPEAATFLLCALLVAAPLPAALGFDASFKAFAADAIARPVGDIGAETDFLLVRAARERGQPSAAAGRLCVTMGVASLAPDAFEPAELVYPDADLRQCATLLVMNRQIGYGLFAESRAKRRAGKIRGLCRGRGLDAGGAETGALKAESGPVDWCFCCGALYLCLISRSRRPFGAREPGRSAPIRRQKSREIRLRLVSRRPRGNRPNG